MPTYPAHPSEIPNTDYSAPRYAVVPSQGCYGSSDNVSPLSVHVSRERAINIAARATKDYRAGMVRYGGSSGGYRVIETQHKTASDASWSGYALDRIPSARS